MKNPWMSLWLSAANRAAGTARGLWIAEAQRQQQAFVKGLTKGAAPGRKPAAARRRK